MACFSALPPISAPTAPLTNALWVLDTAYRATERADPTLTTPEARVAYIRGLIASYRQYPPSERP